MKHYQFKSFSFATPTFKFFLVATAFAAAVVALAPAATFYGASSAGSTIRAADRELTSLLFAGSPTTMQGNDFLRFGDGRLFEAAHGDLPARLFNWTDAIPRDNGTSGNRYLFNPDRADAASSLGIETTPSWSASLADVFGSFGGYKNMSFILDGETASQTYYADLLFANNVRVSADNDTTTVEVALLERGRNSDMNLYGILGYEQNGSAILTPALRVNRSQMGPSLWTLNTLEIGDDQPVGGVGISLDPSWTNLVGLRVESAGSSFDGPDLVGVGVTPEPTSLLLAAGSLLFVGRRRQ